MLQVPSDPGGGRGSSPNLVESYTVEYADNADFANSTMLVVSTVPGQTVYQVTTSNQEHNADFTIMKGGLYFFRVSCTNQVGSSQMSDRVQAFALSAPSSPLNLAGTISSGGVLLSWSLPLDTGTGSNSYPLQNYVVEISQVDPSEIVDCPTTSGCSLIQINASILNYRPQDLVNGVSYYFRIYAENDAGLSPPSPSIEVMARGVPSSPTSVAAVWLQASGSVSVTWSAPLDSGFGAAAGVGTIEAYQVECSLTSDFFRFLSYVVVASTASFSNLIRGKMYYFRVAALNVAGIGMYSNVVSLSANILPQVVLAYTPSASILPPPDGLNPTAPSNGGANILVMVRDSPHLNLSTDRCLIYFGNSVIQVTSVTQTTESCSNQQLFRTVLNFTVPAMQVLSQLQPFAVTVSFQQRQSVSNCSFRFRYVPSPVLRVSSLFPTAASTDGGDLVMVGIDGFGQMMSISDVQISALTPHYQSAVPEVVYYSENLVTSTLWISTTPTIVGEFLFAARNLRTAQTVLHSTVLDLIWQQRLF